MGAKREARLELLAGIDLFYGCLRRELVRVAALTTERPIVPGQVVCREGEPGLEAYVVVHGTAEITIGGQHVARVGPGSFFGELALLDGGPRLATVVALEPMTLLVLTGSQFRAVLADLPYVTGHILKILGTRLRHAECAAASDLAPADARLASVPTH